MAHLTFRVTVGETWRMLPERAYLGEFLALRERDFVGVANGPITIEAMDERGRICWRACYRGYRALARDLVRGQKRVLDPWAGW